MLVRALSVLTTSMVLCACVTVTKGGPGRKVNKTPWLQASALLQDQIDQQEQRLPYTHGEERIEQIHWFASVGEPAYPTLLAMATDPRPDVAGSALAALGATRDSRLVEHLRKLPAPASSAPNLAYERARTLLRLGDWSECQTLIGGLRDEDLMMRALCARALSEATDQGFGFDPQASQEQREQAVQRWEQWWQSRQVEGVLTANS